MVSVAVADSVSVLVSFIGVIQREIYPHAPIVLAAVEVRHSLVEPLDHKQLAVVSAQIGDALPLRDQVNRVSFVVTGAPGQAPSATQQVAPRWMSRDKRTAMTMRPDAVVLETTAYGSYERLREVLVRALAAREASASNVGLERVGLRYIDEVRVPPGNGSADISWGEWLHGSLLGPVAVGSGIGLRADTWQGISAFTGEEGRGLVLRYGPREGYAVAPDGDLRRPTPAPGPFFLLDIDSYWTPPGDIPDLRGDDVMEIIDRLHVPVRDVFEGLISEKLRDEVLRGK